MRSILLPALLSMVFTFPACTNGQQNTATQQKVSPKATEGGTVPVDKFAALMKEHPGTVLDVRSPGEWQQGIISGATLMDRNGPDFKEQLATLDKQKPVFVYCAAGGRSRSAMEVMRTMGFSEVYDLDGGMGAWQDAGREVAPVSSAAKR